MDRPQGAFLQVGTGRKREFVLPDVTEKKGMMQTVTRKNQGLLNLEAARSLLMRSAKGAVNLILVCFAIQVAIGSVFIAYAIKNHDPFLWSCTYFVTMNALYMAALSLRIC